MNTTQAAFAGAAQRGALVRGKFIPKATYSADTTAFSQNLLDALSTAIVRFIHRQSKETARNKRSITLTLTTHQPKSGAANDPLHTIFQNRIMAARRAYHKQPQIAQLMQELYNKYELEQKPGTQALDFRFVTPLARHKPITQFCWNKTRPQGPIALLLQQSRQRCCSIGHDWMIQSNHHTTADIMNTPINHLKTTLRKINATADFWVMGISRPAFFLHWEIDIKTTLLLTRAPIPKLPDADGKPEKAQQENTTT